MGLCNVHAACVSMNPTLWPFECLNRFFVKLGMCVIAPQPISMARFINPLSVFPCFRYQAKAQYSASRLSLLFFFKFPNWFAICRDTFSNCFVGKPGRVEECSVAALRNKRVKTVCGCWAQRVQTKEKYKLRLTAKAYKLERVCLWVRLCLSPITSFLPQGRIVGGREVDE
jgi:hypothetical protein